jgi:hypothetical protein
MLAKRLQLDIVYNRAPKEHLSSEDLKKPEVAKQIEQQEYFDIRTHLPSNKINALEKLVELEYVEKQVLIMHQIIFSYKAHPYVPYVGWQGIVGISSKSRASNKILTPDTIQYENLKIRKGIWKSNSCGETYTYNTL